MCTQVILAVAIAYIPPLNIVFSTQPMFGVHWALFVPWVVFIFTYDELRKLAIRHVTPHSYIESILYW